MGGRILAKGAACFRCRKLKSRCSGSKPRCHRCSRLEQRCVYPGERVQEPRTPTTEHLQARLLELEVTANIVLLSSINNLSVIVARLRRRINQVGAFNTHHHRVPSSIFVYQLSNHVDLSRPASQLSGVEGFLGYVQEGQTLETERSIVEHTLDSFHWTRGEELPSSMSLCLTGIFLPYRSHFNFFIPLLDFLPRLSLPPSHPRSIHPCLRDACHLAACSVLGGRWSHLEPYFAERTRHFLNAALMLVNLEHMTQFLWASVILASYFTRVRRVQESYAIISPASHLVAACGLLSTHDPGLEHGYRADQFLLPAPKTEVEALERIWLAQSVFITDRSLHMLIGYPGTFPCDKRCIPSLDKTEITYPSFKPKMTTEKELMKMWQSDVYRAASVMHLFSLVTTFAEFTHSGKTTRDQMDITLIQSFIQFHDATIPSFLGRANSSPSTVLLPHTTLYGGAAIFYSLFPRNDARARGEMIRFVEKLVEICKQVLEHTQPHFVQASLVPMVHMMNAIRILAHELRNSDVQANPTLAAEYCHFIEILLEFIDDMMGFYPAWGDSTELVKGVINLALESLHNKSEDHTIAALANSSGFAPAK